MITADSFLTHSLTGHPAIRRILAGAIQAVEPGNSVRWFVQRVDDRLFIDGKSLVLSDYRDIHILSVGKASHAMASPLPGLLSGRPFRGLIVTKYITAPPPPGFEQIAGGHPLPNEASMRAGERALEFLSQVQADDLLICLISGGGSALMTAPNPGVTLDDMQSLTRSLLLCGARVDEINTLRRHLDQLKGGGIACKAHPARIVSLILSDVVGNPLEAIASGPTAPDPTSKGDALYLIQKYGLMEQVPSGIIQALVETPKPGEKVFQRVQNVLVGSNEQAAEAAHDYARAAGLDAMILQTNLQGEARDAAEYICARLREELRLRKRPFCLVAGGETTVTVRGKGRGGRNQELALACAKKISGLEDVLIVSLATDGEDGPSDAAGAVVAGETFKRGTALAMNAADFLTDNDSHQYFSRLGDLLKPGPTGTNVNDLIFCFAF
jgi:glycerate 2-kinase